MCIAHIAARSNPRNPSFSRLCVEGPRAPRWVRVADIEADAFKRDGSFLWKLALVLVAGVVAGVFMFAYLTGESVTGCAAEAIGGSSEAAETP